MVRIKIKVIHDFIIGSSLAHTDDHAHGVIERQFSKILPRKIVIVYEIPKNESGKIIKNNRQIQK